MDALYQMARMGNTVFYNCFQSKGNTWYDDFQKYMYENPNPPFTGGSETSPGPDPYGSLTGFPVVTASQFIEFLKSA